MLYALLTCSWSRAGVCRSRGIVHEREGLFPTEYAEFNFVLLDGYMDVGGSTEAPTGDAAC